MPLPGSVIVPIHPDGRRFIALFAAAALGLSLLAWPLGVLGAVLTAWCTYFFRDPHRVTPIREGLFISPADGLVQAVDSAAPPPELGMGDGPRRRIGIFMNVFDVHVNRIPCDGTVERTAYRPGKFLNASLDKASEDNERQSIRLRRPDGSNVAVVQIAGLIARRIRCDVRDGQTMRAGERIGLIRFGSRVDVYLPPGVEPTVAEGQRTIAGETVLADSHAQEPARTGEIR